MDQLFRSKKAAVLHEIFWLILRQNIPEPKNFQVNLSLEVNLAKQEGRNQMLQFYCNCQIKSEPQIVLLNTNHEAKTIKEAQVYLL